MLAEEYAKTDSPDLASKRVVFAQVPAEEAVDISAEFNIVSVPFTFLVRNGERIEKLSGGDIVKLRDALAALLAGTGATATGASAGDALPPAQTVNPLAPADISSTSTTAGVPSSATTAASESTTQPTAATTEQEAEQEESEEELFKQLEALVTASPVMLFMKGTPSDPECGFSRKIVALLREKNIRYGFFNILANQRVREGLKKFATWPTYPQLWVQGELVGGLDIVGFSRLSCLCTCFF